MKKQTHPDLEGEDIFSKCYFFGGEQFLLRVMCILLLCLQENQFPSLSLGLFYGCFPTSHFISGLLCRYSLVCEPCVNKCIFHYDILLYVTVFGREDFRSSLGYSPSVSKAQQYRMSQCFVFYQKTRLVSVYQVLSSFLIVCVRNGLKTRQNLPMHKTKEA